MGGFDKPADTFTKDAAGKFKARDYSYDLYTADFADIFGSSNANNVHTETGTVTVEDTIKPTIKTDDYTYADTWECGYAAFDYRAKSKNAQYSDCFDDTISKDITHGSAQITIACTEDNTSGLIDEVNSYTFASPKRKGTPHANAAGAYNAGAENHVEGNTATAGFMDSVTLTYKLQDTFGNQADDVTRTVKISDTIAPTLYITQSSIRSAGYVGGKAANTCTGAACKCLHQAGGYSNADGVTGDFTTEHCVQNHHDGTTTTATRVHDQLGAGGDAG